MIRRKVKVRHRVEAARKHLRGKLLLAEPMSRHTTLGVGGPADAYFEPEDRGDMVRCLRVCREMDIPVLVMGNGSNLLVRDGGFRGMVVSTTKLTGIRLEGPPEAEGAVVASECGVLMSRLLNFCVSHGLSGLEFTTGIPGTVGGAVAMNAGAYGSCLGDVVEWVEVLGDGGEVERVARGRISFGYRSCRLPVEGTVAAAAFRLSKAPEARILERVKELLQERGRKLPFGWKNAGSIFRNPEGDHAGRLIEELGFKGRALGGAQVSEAHANVIVNTGSAKARDVLNLMEEIQRACLDKKGVALEPEIKVVGEG